MLAGLAFMAAGGVWLSLSGSMLEASIARLISGIGAVMLNVLVTKMVADLFEGKERLLAMSILINSWPIGIGLALWIVGLVTRGCRRRSGIASTVVFSVIGFTVVAFVFRGPTAAAPAVRAEVGIGVLTRRSWEFLLFIAGLPWMLYNAAYQIMSCDRLRRGRGQYFRAGQLVALNTVVFVVAVQSARSVMHAQPRPALLRSHRKLVLLALDDCRRRFPSAWLIWLAAWWHTGGSVRVIAEILRPNSRGAGMGVFFTIYYLGCAVFTLVAPFTTGRVLGA